MKSQGEVFSNTYNCQRTYQKCTANLSNQYEKGDNPIEKDGPKKWKEAFLKQYEQVSTDCSSNYGSWNHKLYMNGQIHEIQ